MKRIDSSIFFYDNPKAKRVIADISDSAGYLNHFGEVFCDIERDYYDSAEIAAVYELELGFGLTQKKCSDGKCCFELMRL